DQEQPTLWRMTCGCARAARRRPCAGAQANGLDSSSETSESRGLNVLILSRIEIAFRRQISESREVCRSRVLDRIEAELLHARAEPLGDQAAVERHAVRLGALRGAAEQQASLGGDARAALRGLALGLEARLLAGEQHAQRDHVLARPFLDAGPPERGARAAGG